MPQDRRGGLTLLPPLPPPLAKPLLKDDACCGGTTTPARLARRLAAHCRAAAAAGVSGAARPLRSGGTRAASGSSCFTGSPIRRRLAASMPFSGSSTSSFSAASCLSSSSWSSPAPPFPASSDSLAGSPIIVSPVSSEICSCCLAVKQCAAASSASAKASASACSASAMELRILGSDTARRTRAASARAWAPLARPESRRKARVTMGTSALSGSRASAPGLALAFGEGPNVSRVPNSKTPAPSTVSSRRTLPASGAAATIISSW
mmetsp:Transcript_90900/g.253121  ORF Transcript_90900/g.253121 Transcript_90900/m.253121 type:complete len:264 (-) Transcript_90900:401-1192(-)